VAFEEASEILDFNMKNPMNCLQKENVIWKPTVHEPEEETATAWRRIADCFLIRYL